MDSINYPYQAWVLQPSFKPVEVTIASKYSSFGSVDYGDVSDSGKLYHRSEICKSLEDAIALGRSKLEATRNRIAKLQASHDKKLAALNKAA